MSQPYKPPTKVVSVDTPFRTMVLRADPDFERAKRREPYFAEPPSNGRQFYVDNSKTGPYAED